MTEPLPTDPLAPRDLSFNERATWGECPVCHAPHGRNCDPSVGIPLGLNARGEPAHGGAHLGRLNNAPFRVKLVRA